MTDREIQLHTLQLAQEHLMNSYRIKVDTVLELLKHVADTKEAVRELVGDLRSLLNEGPPEAEKIVERSKKLAKAITAR